MSAIEDAVTKTTGWIKTVTELGVSLILVFVMIDILFPGTTGVIDNVGTIVQNFSSEGLAGLISLLLFLILLKK